MTSRRKLLLTASALLFVLLVAATLRYVRYGSTTYTFIISGQPQAPVTGTYHADGVAHPISGPLPQTVSFSARNSFSIDFIKTDPTGELTLTWIQPGKTTTYTTGPDHTSIALGMTHSWFKPNEHAWLGMAVKQP